MIRLDRNYRTLDGLPHNMLSDINYTTRHAVAPGSGVITKGKFRGHWTKLGKKKIPGA